MDDTRVSRRHRPLGVTVAAVLTALVGLVEVVVGVLVVGASLQDGIAEEDALLARVGGGVLLLAGLVSLVVAVGLWRGVNAARLVATLALIVGVTNSLLLIPSSATAAWLAGGAALVPLAILLLLWTGRAPVFFEGEDERTLSSTFHEEERSRARRLVRWLLQFAVQLVVLALTVALTPGVTAQNPLSLVAATALVTVVGWLVQPVLARVAGLFGWVGALVLALLSNAIVIGLALAITPGIELGNVGEVVLASWVYALAMTLVTWAFSINSQDYLMVHAVRMSMRGPRTEPASTPGVVFVQLDGVPGPVLEAEVRAGNLPTISRWIRSGSHTWTEWVARVPSTTPVSQAGLLHGTNEGIPAFRWYEKDRGELVVANHPPDAALIESRLSNGRGLLADDGVSISNLFSGDAPTSLLTMSGLRTPGVGLGPSRSYAAFFTHPAGFLRAVLLTIGEMVKELFQARRQVRRDIRPRVPRHGSYVLLRGVTNVFLRDLNVALIVEAMMRGAKSVYVDFVDYDEIAHHAGVTRRESMDSLAGLDAVLASLERLASSTLTPRPYAIVLVSDHGQSQGATFRQRYGQSLEELVASLMPEDGTVSAATSEVEGWGPVNVFLGQLAEQPSVSGRLTRRALAGAQPDLGPAAVERVEAGTAPAEDRPRLVVVGSGNLGGIWFAREPGRLTLAQLETVYPGLVQGLASHPGIGFVVVMTERGPLAVGEQGTHLLADGTVTGADPLLGFGRDARADFLRVAQFEHAPDLYVNSLYDPVLDEVAAFEELVGCHGGLGGWQTRPILVYPAEWALDADLLDDQGRLYGADVVHRQLVRWLERLGHRAALSSDAGASDAPVAPSQAPTDAAMT